MFSKNFKIGTKIIFENEPCNIENSEFFKPGKGQAFIRVKIRKLLSGQLIDRSFRSNESFEQANIIDVKLLYLYKDNFHCYFLNKKNCEEYTVKINIISNILPWLSEQKSYLVKLWNNQIITVVPNNFIELQVVKTSNSFKGESVTHGFKFAELTNGIKIKVPLFININNIIKIDTRTIQYISRIKKIVDN
ncbi:MAG: elongation factor P [Buchnera aphidicola (Eriosoma harunire)]